MAIRIVQLGSPRRASEGLRIGTVRRPPRGVPKAKIAAGDWYDVWFPTLAPSAELVAEARSAQTPAQWRAFERAYRREMAQTEARHAIALLATMSRQTHFSVGCYCDDESHCHRSVLRTLLAEAGAMMSDD